VDKKLADEEKNVQQAKTIISERLEKMRYDPNNPPSKETLQNSASEMGEQLAMKYEDYLDQGTPEEQAEIARALANLDRWNNDPELKELMMEKARDDEDVLREFFGPLYAEVKGMHEAMGKHARDATKDEKRDFVTQRLREYNDADEQMIEEFERAAERDKEDRVAEARRIAEESGLAYDEEGHRQQLEEEWTKRMEELLKTTAESRKQRENNFKDMERLVDGESCDANCYDRKRQQQEKKYRKDRKLKNAAFQKMDETEKQKIRRQHAKRAAQRWANFGKDTDDEYFETLERERKEAERREVEEHLKKQEQESEDIRRKYEEARKDAEKSARSFMSDGRQGRPNSGSPPNHHRWDQYEEADEF